MSKQVAAAVNWWAERLAEEPKFDNGDDSPRGGYVMEMATTIAGATAVPTATQLDVFRQHLTRDLEAAADKWLGCDYGPCAMLADAANVAGINVARFPWKTNMYVEGDKVRVAHGYGAPFVDVPT